ENGWYIGLQYQPHRRFSLITYMDRMAFPWAKYRVDGPSRGQDLFAQATYSWNRHTHLSTRYRFRKKQLNTDLGLPQNTLVETGHRQFRISFESRLNSGWRVRNRFEILTFQVENAPDQLGWMFYQDLFYQPMGAKLSGNIRFAVFRTSGYDSRIYA